MRDILLKCTNLHDALNLLADDDAEVRRHLESLLITEWENGFNAGQDAASSGGGLELL